MKVGWLSLKRLFQNLSIIEDSMTKIFIALDIMCSSSWKWQEMNPKGYV